MSYTYFLVRLSDVTINSLREFDGEDKAISWMGSIEVVNKKITELYPQTVWEYSEVKYNENNVVKTITGDIKEIDGRFEYRISDYPIDHIDIDGSININQEDIIINIAKYFNTSVFDVQTGEIVYLQTEMK